MSNRTLALAAAALLGGLALSAGSVSAAPLSVSSAQADSAIVTHVQMARMERRMMQRRMDRRMDRRMMERRMDRRMMNRM
ncbi:hypothetical protein [Methylobacterium sp. R2-1]|uniref:hypothetical protein n=1 Tax=Methylobacterium sp. R2-1 TaxID=2587064 RepID=UPI001616D5B8|nr:hypothetical protein [Methylobacterium sp. R2-1]MBB2961787.1 hypothetical protein [Methylobacterium sp. R2-1]